QRRLAEVVPDVAQSLEALILETAARIHPTLVHLLFLSRPRRPPADRDRKRSRNNISMRAIPCRFRSRIGHFATVSVSKTMLTQAPRAAVAASATAVSELRHISHSL